MTKAQRRFIETWQKTLRIQDWNITVKEKRFKSKHQAGATLTYPKFMDATIWLKPGLSKREFRRTAVHELLHVRFSMMSFQDGSALEHELEIGIEVLTRILLK